MTILEIPPDVTGGGEGHPIMLTGSERSRVSSLAERLVRTDPGLLDDPGWLRHARQLSCHLPASLLEAVRRYRHESGENGILLIGNLPIDEDALPDTPGLWGSVERAATVPAAVSLLIGLQLGEVVAYRAEKDGAMVQNVLPVRGMEASQSNAGSEPLDFHVENAFHPHRPDYVGLLCLRSDHKKIAETLVSSIRQAFPAISEADLDILRKPRFVTEAPPSFGTDGHTAPHAILDASSEDPNIVLDFQATTALDDDAKGALKRLCSALSEVAVSVVLQPGEMVLADNRIVLHARSLFTPRYDGRDRWLHRVYVSLDHRRSRSHRPGNGAVLI
jgi:L-asparagine oxygenase